MFKKSILAFVFCISSAFGVAPYPKTFRPSLYSALTINGMEIKCCSSVYKFPKHYVYYYKISFSDISEGITYWSVLDGYENKNFIKCKNTCYFKKSSVFPPKEEINKIVLYILDKDTFRYYAQGHSNDWVPDKKLIQEP